MFSPRPPAVGGPHRPSDRRPGAPARPGPPAPRVGGRPGTGGTGPRPRRHRRPAGTGGSRGTGGRHSHPGRARPRQVSLVRASSINEVLLPCTPVWILQPPQLGQGDLVVGVLVEDRLVELGGRAHLALVLVAGRLVQGLLDLLGLGLGEAAGGGLSRLPVRGEQVEGHHQGGGERQHRADQEPRHSVGIGTGRGRACAALVGRMPAPASLGEWVVPSSTATEERDAPGSAPARSATAGSATGSPPADGPPTTGRAQRRQPDQIPLTESQIVVVGEVTGQILGVGVGQRLVEELAALLGRLWGSGVAGSRGAGRDRRR